ncbi:uncharacterized protein LOC132304790 [Cornus florida]|uniref:uncharacterized protein LOC132304790 n=1 Tax=Cornus florida TaxID=4283 RepID=UPI00289E4AE2|nr:uncharacterized protein LOC132304790 [Cornus florida]
MSTESDSDYVPSEEEVHEDEYAYEKKFEPEANITKSSKTKEKYKIKASFHRSSIPKFIEIVAKLNSEKRKDVKDIGFEFLLGLNCSHLLTPLFDYLIEQFEADKCGIKLKGNQLLPINAFEVHNILGLPAGIVPVPTSRQFSADWIDKGGYRESLSVDELMKRVVECKAGDNFKRAIVLFACTTVLTPNSRYHAHVQELLAVDNVKAISSYNWCPYVVDHVVGSLGEKRLITSWGIVDLSNVNVGPTACGLSQSRPSNAALERCIKDMKREIRNDAENTKTLKRKVKKIEILIKKKSRKDFRGEEQQFADEPRDEEDREEREIGGEGESVDGDVFERDAGDITPTTNPKINDQQREEGDMVVAIAMEQDLSVVAVVASNSQADINVAGP